jgi:hypothetical protein
MDEAQQGLVLYESSLFRKKLQSDVLKLLWFADGPLENFKEETLKNQIKIGNFILYIDIMGTQEPSLISLRMPIYREEYIEKLDYYPSYSNLTPGQRYKYVSWLSNPFNQIDIGYVFIFYYGLERHLLFGNFESAFNMICRLRQYHKHNSFLSYSLNALIVSAMIKQRKDLLLNIIQKIQPDEIKGSMPLYIFAKCILGLKINPDEIISIARLVGFTNRRYIKDEYDLFKKHLATVLTELYNEPFYDLTVHQNAECPLTDIVFLANLSIETSSKLIKIPNIIEDKNFKDSIYSLLNGTHQNVKESLKLERKQYGTKREKIQKNINIKSKEDIERKITEYQKLKQQLEEEEKHIRNSKDIIDIHFFYQNKIEIHYKYRDYDQDALQNAIYACKQQINISSKAKIAFLRSYPQSPLPSHVGYKQLAIIEEKRKNYLEAMIISRDALLEGWDGDWEKRIKRCEGKIKYNKD